MEKLITKLKERFSLTYLIFCDAFLLTEFGFFIYYLTNNYSVFDVFQFLVTLLIQIGLYGLGLYFLTKGEMDNFRKAFLIILAYYLVSSYVSFSYIFYEFNFKSVSGDAYGIIQNIIYIFHYIAAGALGVSSISYILFKKDIWRKVANYAFLAIIAISSVFAIFYIVGTCMDKTAWVDIISSLENVAFYALLLAGFNKFCGAESK